MAATAAAATDPGRAADWRRAILGLAAFGALGVAIIFVIDAAAWDRDPRSRAGFILLAAGTIVAVTAFAIYLVSRRIAPALPAVVSRPAASTQAALLDAALAQISQGLCVFDSQQRLAVANQRFAAMFAVPARWLRPGLPFAEIAALSGIAGARGTDGPLLLWPQAAAGGEPQTLLHPMPDGRTIEIDSRPLPDGGRVFACTDVSLRERTQDELRAAKTRAEAADRARSEFLANMSHELRTPLNAIIGFTDVMAAEMFGTLGHPKYREYVEDIQSSGSHLLQIITEILQMAKIDAGKLQLHEESVDLGAVAQFCRRIVRERAAAANLDLVLEFSPMLPPLRADERLVKQMLLNLLANAVKFTPPHGRVIASGECDGDGRIVLAVRDTGIGIAAADIAKALTPFGQINNAYTRAQGGTGLGLPIVKSYAELHGAEFEIESEPGSGTCVRIKFPQSRTVDGVAPL